MTHRSADEIRNECIEKMGKPFGEMYFNFRNELISLHVKWQEFRVLYAESKDVIDILNESAEVFFGSLQDILWKDVLLHLCRLTDNKKVKGKETLSVFQFPQHIKDQGLKEKVENAANEACTKAKFARDWRNRRLAHRELPALTGQKSKPLASASRAHVEEVLESMRNFINLIEISYLDVTVIYHLPITSINGADTLVHKLKLGNEAFSEKYRRR